MLISNTQSTRKFNYLQ